MSKMGYTEWEKKEKGSMQNIQTDTNDRAEVRYQLRREFLQCVKEGNEKQAIEKFSHWSDLLCFSEEQLPFYKYELYAAESLMLYRLEENKIYQRLRKIHQVFLEGILRAETKTDCDRQIKEVIQKCCSLNRSDNGKDYSVMIQKVILMVEQDLMKPLTLQYFAEELSVNSSYLSDLFRRETGQTLTAYVTEQRIRHAKILLETSRDPIKNIAKLSGIADVQYFSKIFKRSTGMTPGQYRQNCS